MTPSASNLAFVEFTPHSLQIAVLSGRKIVASAAFSLEAKADIAAFVAAQQLSGAVRASVIGAKNFLHRSAEAESGAVRQPAALQAHAAKLAQGLDGSPVAVAVDAASGGAPDATRVTPWLLAAVDGASFAAARDTLDALGLRAADLTVAAPALLGVVAGSLPAGETALVLIPGEDDAQIAWVSAEGVVAVAASPVGYADIFEAVQRGLGLKFKAAAGKLFYNESYDFGDAAPKIAEPLASALQPLLNGKPAVSRLHLAGLLPGQAWLTEALAKALKLQVWAPAGPALATRLGLDSTAVKVSAASAGLLPVAAAGASDTAWVQSTLEALSARPRVTASPFPPKATAPVGASEAPKAKSAGVESVAVRESAPARAAAPAPAAKGGGKGPIFIAAGVGVVAAVVGLAWHFRSPKDRADEAPASAKAVPAAPAAAPVESAPPSPESATPAAPAPVVTAPAVSTPSGVGSADSFASDARKFGNDRYRFEVSEKGFIQALATPRDEVLVESAAGISLQGSYVGTDGRRKWFNVGGVDDVGYQATVKKTVEAGVTVFNVKVTHPRFEMEQTFRCLPDSVKVSAKFSPINLRDPRGVIAAVHSVRLSPVALNPSQRMRAASDAFAYAMKAGTLRVGFDSSVWARDGAEGRQTIIAGENGVAFHFTETNDATRNSLNYEIAVP